MKNVFVPLIILISCVLSFIAGCDYNRIHSPQLTEQLPVNLPVKYAVKIDSFEVIKTQPGKFIYRVDSVFVATNSIIDTAAIIRSHQTKYFQIDSFRNSELALISQDSIFENRSIWKQYLYKILRPDSVITKTIITKQNQVWAGLGIASVNGSSYLNPEISYMHKKGFGAQAGLMIGPNNPGYSISLNFLIK
jgi:hypothetical protein